MGERVLGREVWRGHVIVAVQDKHLHVRVGAYCRAGSPCHAHHTHLYYQFR